MPKKGENSFDLVDINQIKYDNIEEIEVMIIDKRKMQKYASSIGITKDNFEKKATDLISTFHESDIDRLNLEKSNGNAWLKYTNRLHEEPVSLVIRKSKLKELTIKHKIIQRKNFNK